MNVAEFTQKVDLKAVVHLAGTPKAFWFNKTEEVWPHCDSSKKYMMLVISMMILFSRCGAKDWSRASRSGNEPWNGELYFEIVALQVVNIDWKKLWQPLINPVLTYVITKHFRHVRMLKKNAEGGLAHQAMNPVQLKLYYRYVEWEWNVHQLNVITAFSEWRLGGSSCLLDLFKKVQRVNIAKSTLQPQTSPSHTRASVSHSSESFLPTVPFVTCNSFWSTMPQP